MGKAIYTGTPGEIPVPDTTPEITPDGPERPAYQPEIKPDKTPSPAAPQTPGKPDSPGREPEVPKKVPETEPRQQGIIV